MQVTFTEASRHRFRDADTEYDVDIDGVPAPWRVCVDGLGRALVRATGNTWHCNIPVHNSLTGDEALAVAKTKIAEAEAHSRDRAERIRSGTFCGAMSTKEAVTWSMARLGVR